MNATNEEDDVGMVQLGQEGHLGSELQHAPLVQLLFDEPLHRHLDALPSALVDHAVAAHADLVVPNLDLLEVDDPSAEVG